MFPTSLQPRRAAGTELVGHGFLTLCMTAARFAVLVLVTSHAREEIPAPCGAQDQSSSWIPKQSQEPGAVHSDNSSHSNWIQS